MFCFVKRVTSSHNCTAHRKDGNFFCLFYSREFGLLPCFWRHCADQTAWNRPTSNSKEQITCFILILFWFNFSQQFFFFFHNFETIRIKLKFVTENERKSFNYCQVCKIGVKNIVVSLFVVLLTVGKYSYSFYYCCSVTLVHLVLFLTSLYQFICLSCVLHGIKLLTNGINISHNLKNNFKFLSLSLTVGLLIGGSLHSVHCIVIVIQIQMVCLNVVLRNTWFLYPMTVIYHYKYLFSKMRNK